MVGMKDGMFMVSGSAWRKGLYAMSLTLALLEMVTGLIAQRRDEWVLPWVVCVLLPQERHFVSNPLCIAHTLHGL